MSPEQFADLMNEAADRIEAAPLPDAMAQALDLLQGGVADAFAEKVDSAGTPWPPRKDNLPHPLLNKTGKLKTAATGGGTAGDRSASIVIPADEVPYASVHQRGSAKKNIPRREYVYASGETLDACGDAIADEAERVIFGEP